MPLLADPGHAKLTAFLETLPGRLGSPGAIVVISAHWEMSLPHVTAGTAPTLIYDYGGFPPESYEIKYPAPGSPGLAQEIAGLLEAVRIPCVVDAQRGFDHGMFVPLKLMYPDADIPVIQLSLLASLDAGDHIALGQALKPLLEKNILVVGSGMSFHNLRAFFVPDLVSSEDNLAFEHWLQDTCSGDMAETDRAGRLGNWHKAPGGLKCHPRPEHLLPLHVCYSMASTRADVVFSDTVMDRWVTGLLWQ
jgi:aromatic ring-opening dioxygenase catalytic subunit (LigB family)